MNLQFFDIIDLLFQLKVTERVDQVDRTCNDNFMFYVAPALLANRPKAGQHERRLFFSCTRFFLGSREFFAKFPYQFREFIKYDYQWCCNVLQNFFEVLAKFYDFSRVESRDINRYLRFRWESQ